MICPAITLSPDIFLIAPLLETPVPEIVIPSAAVVIPPEIFKAALFATVVAPLVPPKASA